MSKFISSILALFTISVALIFDLIATNLQGLIVKYVNAIPYVLPLLFFNLIIAGLLLLQSWLVLIRSERSVVLSVFLITAAAAIVFILPLVSSTSLNISFLAMLRPSETGRSFIEQVYFPIIKAGPRSYNSFSGVFTLGVGVINLFRKNVQESS